MLNTSLPASSVTPQFGALWKRNKKASEAEIKQLSRELFDRNKYAYPIPDSDYPYFPLNALLSTALRITQFGNRNLNGDIPLHFIDDESSRNPAVSEAFNKSLAVLKDKGLIQTRFGKFEHLENVEVISLTPLGEQVVQGGLIPAWLRDARKYAGPYGQLNRFRKE